MPSRVMLASGGSGANGLQRALATLALASCLMICNLQNPQPTRTTVGSNQVHCSPQAFSSSGQPKSFLASQTTGGSGSSSEIHQVRGLSGSGQRIELPCLVDQANCGEVYYITWTRQSLSQQQSSGGGSLSATSPATLTSQQESAGSVGHGQWSRVYLYTGANDSAPHKPIGDLISRASFLMPDKRLVALADDEERASPMARLVIEDPKLSDEALYKCDVTYVKGKCPSISLVRVHMLSLPAKAQIQLVHQPEQAAALVSPATPTTTADGQLIGPYNEHEQLKLSCLVFGGRPQPKSVIWRKIDPQGRTTNLQTITAPSHRQHQQIGAKSSSSSNSLPAPAQASLVQVELNHTLSSSDLGAKFECHVDHEALEQPATRVVVANSQQSQQSTVASGQLDQMLDLHPGLAPPQPDNNQNNEDGSEQQASASNSLSLAQPVKSLDAHVFVDLNVEAASLDLFMTKVNKRNSSEPLREGDLVELECVAYNSKPPANISWFNGPEAIEQLEPTAAPMAANLPTTLMPTAASSHANWPKQKLRHKRLLQRNQVHQNEDGQTFNTHSFLSIKLSRHENRAQISCRAQNAPMRQPLVKSLELQVQHAPIVLMEPAGGIVVSESCASPGLKQQANGESVIESMLAPAALPAGASQEQQDVSIYCVYSANPSELLPGSTRWFKDGRPLSGAARESSSSSGNSLGCPDSSDQQQQQQQHERRFIESTTAAGFPVLTVRQVKRQDAGLYECQLANSVGQSERLPASEASRLEVNFRPSVQARLFKPPIGAAGQPQQQPPASVEGGQSTAGLYQPSELAELDLSQELILPGSSFVLICDVLDAQPSKIHKFHWFKSQGVQAQAQTQTQAKPSATSSQRQQLIQVSESNQLSLGALGANFTPTAYSCSASNSLGPSELSRPIELQLSYAPGPSFVRPVNELQQQQQQRRLAANSPQAFLSVRPAASSPDDTTIGQDWPQQQPRQQQTLGAGRELLLECVTPDLGQPRANIWLWFKNGQPLESAPATASGDNDDGDLKLDEAGSGSPPEPLISARERDNPIRSAASGGQGLSAHSFGERSPGSMRPAAASRQPSQPKKRSAPPKIRLLNSGRHLLIPAIQLGHRGNYSCVAVNRLGSGLQQQEGPAPASATGSWQLRVAMAPSFVRALPAKTFWQESSSQQQVELFCHVQCEPICQLEWLKNNEPLEPNASNDGQLSYQVRQSIMDEDLEANQFRSIESRLTLRFSANSQRHRDGSAASALLLEPDQERWKRLERRRALSGANYSCQSSPNSMGAGAKSSTKFIVQYPPENLLVNAASDKLSLVEGSNGPRLSCEASGEPQPQYRWFLLKGGPTGAFLADQEKQKERQRSQAASLGQAAPINQPAKGANESPTAPTSMEEQAKQQGELLVELSATLLADGSLLDLSATSLDRGQAGRYICEASNSLGQTRESIPVNVLYKPTCAALHLHSLDSTERLMPTKTEQSLSSSSANRIRAKPLNAAGDQYSLVRETSEDFIDLRKILVLAPLLNRHQPTTTTMTAAAGDESLSFRGSIFQAILSDKRQQQHQSKFSGSGAQFKDNDALIHQDESVGSNNLIVDLSNSDRLISQESSGDAATSSTLSGDSWSKFNGLLLKFLNNYMRQVKSLEERSTSSDQPANSSSRDGRSQRGSGDNNNRHRAHHQHSSPSATQENYSDPGEDQKVAATSSSDDSLQPNGTRNFLTFACLAKDANPISNLSFDWSFANSNLPETRLDENSLSDNIRGGSTQTSGNQKQQADGGKPMLVYADDDFSIQVVLVRRLDTRSSLSPFQMSLLTLNVVIIEQSMTTAARQLTGGGPNGSRSAGQTPARAPVIKNRYQSFYDSLKSSTPTTTANGNNIQFSAHEFVDSSAPSPYDFQTPTSSVSLKMELNARNWQEQLGNLLKCSVTNQIGSSEVCHVRVNLEGRLKGSSSSSSSSSSFSSEFAKWRMPSLAHKSLLIISVLVACALIVFATSALLLGPYLRTGGVVGGGLGALGRLKRDQSGRSSGRSTKEGTESNTGQSTSSQKSSVLGLLGNGGDSSIQGSSDDDSSAGRLNTNNNNHRLGVDRNNNNGNGSGNIEQAARMQLALSRANSYHHNKQLQLAPESSSTSTGLTSGSYDEPRGLQQQQQARLSYHSHNDQLLDGSDVYHYRDELGTKLSGSVPAAANVDQQPQDARATTAATREGSSKTLHGSTGSRLLASLKFKSLSKFKVDRISDLSNFAARRENIRNLHTKNVSSSETNTTGLSLSGELQMTVASPSSSGSSTTFFGPTSQRRSLGDPSFKSRPTVSQLQARQIVNGLEQQQHHAYRQAQIQTIQQLSSQKLLAASNSSGSMAPTYSNMINNPTDAMDEFIRQREHNMPLEQQQTNVDPVSFYRSQSVRHAHPLASNVHSSMYLMEAEDQRQHHNHQFYPQHMNRGPPVYPRTHQAPPLATHYEQRFVGDSRPLVAARTSHRQQQQQILAAANAANGSLQQHQQLQTSISSNRFSMPDFNRSFGYDHPSSLGFLDTIDSHLNRLPETVAMNNHPDQSQLIAYANAIEANTRYREPHNDVNQLQQNHQSVEHIYDVNAYATPEQTPLRRTNTTTTTITTTTNNSQVHSSAPATERPRVSQLIQSFNAKLPE